MGLSSLLSYLQGVEAKDLFTVLSDVNGAIVRFAADKCAPWLIFAFGISIALITGLLGYKLKKVTMAMATGYAGYFIGMALFTAVVQVRFPSVPEWVMYLCAFAVAALFLVLGFVKFSYVYFVMAAVCGYFMLVFYTDSRLVGLGGALVVGVLAVLLPRVSYILASSVGCALLTVSFFHGMLPEVAWLELSIENEVSLVLAACVAVIFLLVQTVTNIRTAAHDKKTDEAPAPVSAPALASVAVPMQTVAAVPVYYIQQQK